MRQFLFAIAVCGVTILSGCNAQRTEPHVLVYQQFVRAVASGDVKAAVGLLSAKSQARIKAAQGTAVEGQVKVPEDWLLLQPGWQFELDVPSAARGQFDSRVPDQAMVTGPLEGVTRSIPMVLEEGEWRIDLFAATRTAEEQRNVR